MRKRWKAVVLVVVALILGITGWMTFRYNHWSPADPAIEIDRASVEYFCDTFDSSRDAFRSIASTKKDAFAGASTISIPVASSTEPDLTVDILYIPAQQSKQRLLILSSGVHGIEGFVGSSVQRMFLKEFATSSFLETTGILVIHAVNPYGFKRKRRVTENNIDLNRNAAMNPVLFETENAAYRSLEQFVNPRERVATRSAGNLFFHFRAITRIARSSMDRFRQAIAQGQYEFRQGIFFGGSAIEPQFEVIARSTEDFLNEYPLVMTLDLHTGYGERGAVHLITKPANDSATKTLMEGIFAGHGIEWAGEGDFYTVSGDFMTFMGELMTEGTYLATAFEYGTLDSQKTLGAIKSLQVMVLENQGVHHGYASPVDEERVQQDFIEMFAPSSPAWKTKVMHDTRVLLNTALENFAATAPP